MFKKFGGQQQEKKPEEISKVELLHDEAEENVLETSKTKSKQTSTKSSRTFDKSKSSEPTTFLQKVMHWIAPEKLPRPQTWDGMERTIKDSTVQTFDGFQFELMRQLSDSFGATHSLSFGGAQEPFSYVFGVTVAENQKPNESSSGKDTNIAQARVNLKDYSVNGMIVYGISPRFTVRLQPMFSSQPHSSGVVLEGDYKGNDHTASVKFIQHQYIWETSYTQSLSRTWAAGSQIVYAHKQGISGLQLMLQRRTRNSTFTGLVNLLAPSIQLHFSQRPQYSWFISSAPEPGEDEDPRNYEVKDPTKVDPIVLKSPDARPYFKFNKDHFTLISELMVFRNPQSGEVEINSRYGFKVAFYTGSFMTNIDIHGAISARYDERFSEVGAVQLSAEVDQRKQAYKVGLGFQFGS